jgi:hypothetical protein
MERTDMMKIWELEKTIELEFIIESATYRFRLEAQKLVGEEDRYRVRLFEYDLFRITPTFDDHPEGGADHEIQVANLLIDGQEYVSKSADEALHIAIKRLHEQGFV